MKDKSVVGRIIVMVISRCSINCGRLVDCRLLCSEMLHRVFWLEVRRQLGGTYCRGGESDQQAVYFFADCGAVF
jgi:hypothetical protein